MSWIFVGLLVFFVGAAAFTALVAPLRKASNIVQRTGRSEADARAALTSRNPQRRLVQPEEVATVVGWLCLPEAQSITGQAIPVAGGEVM